MSAIATRHEGTQADWRCVSLGDICSKPQYGWTTKAKPESGALKLLRTTDITSGQIDWPRVPFCTELPPEPERYLVREGDILISRAGSVGVSHLVTSAEPSVFASYLIRFRPGPDVLPKYLAYFLKSPAYWKQIADNTAGIAIPNVNASKLQDLRIPLAPLEEQRRIVAELEKQFSRLDEAVANLKRVKANLNRYKRAVLKAAVEGRLVPTEAELSIREGRGYDAGGLLLARVLEERRRMWSGRGAYHEPAAPVEGYLPSLPNGWTVASLEGITSATRVICYGILMPKENVADGVLYVKVRDMKDDVIDLASLHRTTRAIAANYVRASLRPGDLLLSIRGTYGRLATVPPQLEGGNITQDTARLDVSRYVDASFVAAFLRSEDAQRYFKSVARGVAVKGVNIGDLRPMAVPLPPLAEQRRIVAEVGRRFSVVCKIEAQVAEGLQRAASLRQATLSKFFLNTK